MFAALVATSITLVLVAAILFAPIGATVLIVATRVAVRLSMARKATSTGIAHFAFGSFFLRRREFFENGGIAFGDMDARNLFDSAEVLFLIGGAERNRDTVFPGAGRTTDAVYERFRYIGQVVVEHMAHIVHIDSTSGNIRRH